MAEDRGYRFDQKNNQCSTRALDSDAATVGQLKALEYAYKEGVVAYYTEENGKNYKVVKYTDGQFYKANTENGTPLDSTKISANKVL